MDNLSAIIRIANSGMYAQGTRMRVISENVANAQTTGTTPGSDAYRRKTISFEEMIDQHTGASVVGVKDIGKDMSEFPLKYDPTQPAANNKGYVKMPNVNMMIEMADHKEAQRSYEANMNMLDAGRRMKSLAIEMLK